MQTYYTNLGKKRAGGSKPISQDYLFLIEDLEDIQTVASELGLDEGELFKAWSKCEAFGRGKKRGYFAINESFRSISLIHTLFDDGDDPIIVESEYDVYTTYYAVRSADADKFVEELQKDAPEGTEIYTHDERCPW